MPTDSATFTKTRTQFLYRRHKTYYARGFANGKTVWKSLNTDLYSAAVVRLPVALAEIKSGAETVVASKATTVGDLIELYLAQVFRTVGIKETTKHYRRQLFTKIRKEWAGVDALIPRKVTVQDTEEFANRLAGISSPTRYNNSIDSLRAVFAIGIDQGLLTKNPFAEVGKLKPRQKKLELPSTEAFTAILKTVRAQGAWCSRPVADLIEFLAYTGCRLSEASNVRWEDVDF